MNDQDILAKAILNLGARSVVVAEDLSFEVEPEGLDLSGLGEALNKASSQVLAERKSEMLAKVDLAAEQERLKYITAGVGQSLTYSEKVQQARTVLASSKPSNADAPLLAAEIGISGETLLDVAKAVENAYRSWLVIGGEIEAVRLSAKGAIRAAGSLAEADEISANIQWPTRDRQQSEEL